MRLIGLLVLALLTFGCGTDANHPFFKPEIQDVTYAVQSVGDPTADDARTTPDQVRVELERKINCPGTEYGHSPCIDMDGTFEGWGFVDDGAVYAAPRITPVKAAPKAIVPDALGDPTADD